MSVLRSVSRARALALLVVLTRLAATLLFGIAVSRSVAGFIGAHPAGELALFEGGAERLAELAPRLRVHPGWPLASTISYVLLLVIPHGALIIRATGAASTSGGALLAAAKRTGVLLFAFVLATVTRVAAVTIAVFAWPRFSGFGSVALVVVIALGWALAEGFVNAARVHAIVGGARIGAALSRGYELRSAVRAGLVTLGHAALQAALGALTVFLSARAFTRPDGFAVVLATLSMLALGVSTSLFAAAHVLIARLCAAGESGDASNGLPTSDLLGYETAPSVEASPGSSVGRAED